MCLLLNYGLHDRNHFFLIYLPGASSRDSPGASARSAISWSSYGISTSLISVIMSWMSVLSSGKGWKTSPMVGDSGELCF
uniref:Uncharacterized protein n=1 Tax=Triticum urartu TaxID=4572 RepID=A0A8R7TB21_TRIUA